MRITVVLGFSVMVLLPAAGLAMVASSSGSTAPAESVSRTGTGARVVGLIGEGWMLNGGYFFKDKLFNNGGRGGVHVNAGRAISINRWIGLWVGVGAVDARGTQRVVLADDQKYRSAWTMRSIYADVGVVIPWMPFPVALALYRQTSEISDEGLTGPLTGRVLKGGREGYGLAIDIHILFEWFVFNDRKPPQGRGLGFVLGYNGFIDLMGHDVATSDAFGGTAVHRNWKPMAGESLRAGIEYEF